MHQPFHDLRIVIHALEQHGLCAQRHARVRQLAARGLHLRRQFVWMVEMQVHINRVIFFHDFTKLGSDAFRQRAGDAGADPD